MEQIKSILRDSYGLKVEERGGNLYGNDRFIKVCVVPPIRDFHFRYVISFSTIAAFKSWGQSMALSKEFNTEEEATSYLTSCKAEVYEELLKYLFGVYDTYSRRESGCNS